MSKETFDRYSQNHHGHEIQKQKSTSLAENGESMLST